MIEGCVGAATASCIMVGAFAAVKLEVAADDIVNALGSLAGIGLGVMGAVWSALYVERRKVERAAARDRSEVLRNSQVAAASLLQAAEAFERGTDFDSRKAALMQAHVHYRIFRFQALAATQSPGEFSYSERGLMESLIADSIENEKRFTEALNSYLEKKIQAAGTPSVGYAEKILWAGGQFIRIYASRLEALAQRLGEKRP